MNYSRSSSCLVFFFFFSLFHHFSYASNKTEAWCSAKFECGNIKAGFPFWGGDRPEPCGHPWLQLKCNKDNTSITISNQDYNVLHLDQTSNTLRLVRKDLQGSFCNATFTSITLPPKIFQLSPSYETLTVFYLCNPNFSYRSNHTCLDKGLISVNQSPNYQDSCEDFTVKVPKSFLADEEEFNLGDLESVLKQGFEVKLMIDEKPCQECSSSGGICGFNKWTQICCNETDPQGLKCSPLHPSRDQNNLLYPFWNDGREECGHPDFKLNCTESSAELTISSVKFRILSANYDSGKITLVRSDYIGNLCPSDPVNAQFNETVLPLAPETELLTLYYGCNGLSLDISGFSYVGELGCGDDDNSYYVTRNLSSLLLGPFRTYLDSFREFCPRRVTIPASKQTLTKLEESRSRNDLQDALDQGFELGVNQNCSRCMNSRGACGYNLSISDFVCYCIDGSHNRICGSQDKGIGLASGLVIAFLIAGGVFCLLSRRKKKREADQYTSKDLPVMSYSSRDQSSHPTSLTISSSNHSLLPSMSNLGNGSVYLGVKVFSYEELEEATENFSRELGDGGFGTVYYGVLKDGRAVAVKRLYERSLKRVEQFKNEIEILKSLKHPNLVILYGCTSRHSRELLLVYEFISNGTLADHLHGDRAESRPLCWTVRLNVAIETASALSYLHASGIIHRDVKTTNILLDENHQVKVADFGLSRLFPMDQTHISTAPQGTPGYVDPEYYQCYRLNEKSDVYSFGVVLTELLSSKEAVDITRHRHDINLANMALTKIQNNAVHELVDPTLGFAKDPEVRRKMMSVAELAFRCLQQEREIRPSMDEIVEILRGIKGQKIHESPEVLDIDRSNGDDIGLLRHSVPPPISPETDKWTSSSTLSTRSF